MVDLENEMWRLVYQSATLVEILERSPALHLPNWYFGGGCLAQTIWNMKTGGHSNSFIKDIDWVYFDDSDLTEESEARNEALVRSYFNDIPIEFDVKNQARVHVWYSDVFGYEIKPYVDVHAAIATWPTTATAVALTKFGGTAKVFAPFGLNDLLTLTVRPNKKQITESIYLAKVERWQKCWPQLNVLRWDDKTEL